jgi:hypothetical protein
MIGKSLRAMASEGDGVMIFVFGVRGGFARCPIGVAAYSLAS